jgi:hypothetical protein
MTFGKKSVRRLRRPHLVSNSDDFKFTFRIDHLHLSASIQPGPTTRGGGSERGSQPLLEAGSFVPPSWDGPHVGKRLVDGLRTLALVPRVNGPRGPTNSWPLYAHSWEDLLAQEEAAEEDKRQNQHEANRTRVQPSSVEIMHMEQSMCWPMRYLRELPRLIRTVQAVAVARSRDSDTHGAARRLRLPGRVVRKWSGEGLAMIAHGLGACLFSCCGS